MLEIFDSPRKQVEYISNYYILIIASAGDLSPLLGHLQTQWWTRSTLEWLKYIFLSSTHWGQDKMAVIFQTTFSTAFPWMEMFEFRLKFHWNLFLRVQLIILQHWFRKWLGAEPATSHYLNQWWPTLVTHICVPRPQWVNIKSENPLVCFLDLGD